MEQLNGQIKNHPSSYRKVMLLIKDKKSVGRLPSDFPQPEQQNDGFLNS